MEKLIFQFLSKEEEMPELILIAAIGENGELGKQNQLLWYLPEDLKFFSKKTKGKPIIMGYNTFVSLPKVLPGRKHLVLTHQDLEFPEEVEVFHDKESLLEYIKTYEGEVYVIGGASIYQQFLEDASKMYLTEIQRSAPDADVYFPKFSKENWNRFVLERHLTNEIPYEHILYEKKLVKK